MIKRIKIFNFRSIENADIEIAPLTVLYGPASSGKSSFLYSLLILKNFIINPHQQSDGFFNLGFMNLGGFDNCVFNHDGERTVDIFVCIDDGEYGISLKKNSVDIFLNSGLIKMQAKVSIPYGLNQNFSFTIKDDGQEYTVNWNGIFSSVLPKQPNAETQRKAAEISVKLNQLPNYLGRKIDFVPHRRGFFLPNYSPAPISPNPTSDIEVASIIINDPDLPPKISIDLEKIFNRDFRLYIPPGTATAYLQSTDKSSRIPSYLVNEGFGVNQVVYLLAKIHRSEIKTILIEEPEVHLHPSIIRVLVKTLCSIIKEEKKQIILTTHSEVFVSSLLGLIRRKDIELNDVKCYLVRKEEKSSKFENQEINEKGQIKGGLSSFVEGELEDLKAFFEKD